MATESGSGETVPDRPFLDKETTLKVIGYLLNLAVVVALAVGASFFSDLRTELKDLNKTLVELRVTVATSKEREASLESRIQALEALHQRQ